MSIKLRLLLWYLNTFKKFDYTASPAQIREENAKALPLFHKILDYKPIAVNEIRDEQIQVRDGKKIRIRIYRPSTQGKFAANRLELVGSLSLEIKKMYFLV